MSANPVSISDSVCYRDSYHCTLECEKAPALHLLTATFKKENCDCIANGNQTMLSISHFSRSGDGNVELTQDYSLDFDNDISALCFDPTGSCVIVGDTMGYLHFVTSFGSVIFSHRIYSSESKFLCLKFIWTSNLISAPYLIGLLSNGYCFNVNIPVAAVCKMASQQPEALGMAIKKLTFSSCQINIPLPKEAVLYVSMAPLNKQKFAAQQTLSINMIVVDDYSRFHGVYLEYNIAAKELTVVELSPLLISNSINYTDFMITEYVYTRNGSSHSNDTPLLVLLSDTGDIAVYDGTTFEYLCDASVSCGATLKDSSLCFFCGYSVAVDAPDSHSGVSLCHNVVLTIGSPLVLCKDIITLLVLKEFAVEESGASAVEQYCCVLVPFAGVDSRPNVKCLSLGEYHSQHSVGAHYLEYTVSVESADIDDGSEDFVNVNVAVQETSPDTFMLISEMLNAYCTDMKPEKVNSILGSITATWEEIGSDDDLGNSSLVACGVLLGMLYKFNKTENVDIALNHSLLKASADYLVKFMPSYPERAVAVLDATISNLLSSSDNKSEEFFEASLTLVKDVVHQFHNSSIKISEKCIKKLREYAFAKDTAIMVYDCFGKLGGNSAQKSLIDCFSMVSQFPPVHSWLQFLRSGLFKEAQIVYDRHVASLGNNVSILPADVLKVIPDSGTATGSIRTGALLDWVKTFLFNFFFQNSNVIALQLSSRDATGTQKVALIMQLVLCIKDLLRRAKAIEKHDNCAFNAIQFSECAVQMCSLLPSSVVATASLEAVASDNPNSIYAQLSQSIKAMNDVVEQCNQIHLYLSVSSWIRQNYWGTPGYTSGVNPKSGESYQIFGLSYINSIGGISGIVADLLDSVDIDDDGGLSPSFELRGFLLELCNNFSGNLDELCLKWIDNAVNTRVVKVRPTSGRERDRFNDSTGSALSVEGDSEDDDDSILFRRRNGGDFDDSGSGAVSLLHLVTIAGYMEDIGCKAKAIMLLLQVPIGSGNNDTPAVLKLHGIAEELSQHASVEGSAIGESIIEATKAQRVRSLAWKYGIKRIDLRDKRQIKTAANIIAARWKIEESITDAIDLVSSRSTVGLNLSSVLSRGIILRVLVSDVELECLDGVLDKKGTSADVKRCSKGKRKSNGSSASNEKQLARVRLVEVALKQVPLHLLAIVVENVCSCLMDMMDSAIHTMSELKENLTGDDMKQTELDRIQTDLILSELEWVNLNQGLISIISYFLDSHPSTSDSHAVGGPSMSWVNAELLLSMKNIRALNNDIGIFVLYEQTLDVAACKQVVKNMALAHVDVLVERHKSGNELSPSLLLSAEHRRACGILNVSCVFFLSEVLKKLISVKEMKLAILVAGAMNGERSTNHACGNEGMSDITNTWNGISNQDNAQNQVIRCSEEATLILSAAISFCTYSVKMCMSSSATSLLFDKNQTINFVDLFSAAKQLLTQLSLNCRSQYLANTLDYIVVTDLIVTVYDRFDIHADSLSSVSMNPTGIPDAMSILQSSLYVKDGILLSSSRVLLPLLKFCLKEIQRRSRAVDCIFVDVEAGAHNSLTSSDNGGVSNAVASPSNSNNADLVELLTQLKQSENHVLSLRVLLTSWYLDSSSKHPLTYTSYVALNRRILTYRDIDVELAVAYLGSIPDKTMVKELQSIIPSIQNDFGRLRITAVIGEQLALMWDKEDLLRVFQSLQNNARWWTSLTAQGIKVDTKTFQHPVSEIRSEYIKSIVPELLEKSGMDLELAQDYCRQFDLTSEFANTCYIEKLLTMDASANIGAGTAISSRVYGSHASESNAWEKQVNFAASGVNQEQLVICYRKLLRKIHPQAYDKIKYVCCWLINYLTEEDEVSTDYTKLMGNKNSSDSSSSSDIKTKVPFGNVSIVEEKSVSESLLVNSNKENGSEIKLYSRYIAVMDYLALVHIPTTILVKCKFMDTDTAFPNSNAIGNIPFWKLIDEPWAVLDSLLKACMTCSGTGVVNGSISAEVEADGISLKLSSLCPVLNICKDEFHRKRIKLYYEAHRKSSTMVDSVNSSPEEDNLRSVFLTNMQDNIDFIQDPLLQVQVWRWLYLREQDVPDRDILDEVMGDEDEGEECKKNFAYNETKNSLLGQVALEKAFVIIDKLEKEQQNSLKTSSGKYSSDTSIEVLILTRNLKIDIQSLVVTSKCQYILHEFKRQFNQICANVTKGKEKNLLWKNSFEQLYLHYLDPLMLEAGNPKELLSILLNTTIIEVGWALQLKYLNAFGRSDLLPGCDTGNAAAVYSNVLSTYDVMNSAICPVAMSFFHYCGVAIVAIQKVLMTYDVAKVGKNASFANLSISDAVRHAIVSKYLSEFHFSSNSGSATGSSSNSASDTVELSMYSAVGKNNLSPTVSECRRSEDIFAGFSIAALILSCASSATRKAFIVQLDNVTKEIKSASPGTNKKIAIRSKFRCALALHFLDSGIDSVMGSIHAGSADKVACAGDSADIKLSSDPKSKALYLQYLFCGCELQETRLGTPIETLADLLQSNVTGAAKITAKSLINTWMYDEGDNGDVLELCRDVYIATSCLDLPLWHTLLLKMYHNNHYHILLTTLCILSKSYLSTTPSKCGLNYYHCLISGCSGDGVPTSNGFHKVVLDLLAKVMDESTGLMKQSFELYKFQRKQKPNSNLYQKSTVEDPDVTKAQETPNRRIVFTSLIPLLPLTLPFGYGAKYASGGAATYLHLVNDVDLEHLVIVLNQIVFQYKELGEALRNSELMCVGDYFGASDVTLTHSRTLISDGYKQLLNWACAHSGHPHAPADNIALHEFRINATENMLRTTAWVVGLGLTNKFMAYTHGLDSNEVSDREQSFIFSSMNHALGRVEQYQGNYVSLWCYFICACNSFSSAVVFGALDMLHSNPKDSNASIVFEALLKHCILDADSVCSVSTSSAAAHLLVWFAVDSCSAIKAEGRTVLLKKCIGEIYRDSKSHHASGATENKSYSVIFRRQLMLLIDCLQFSMVSLEDAKNLRDYYLQFAEK